MTQWHANVAHSATWISADFSGTIQQELTRAASCIKHLLRSLACFPKSSIVVKTNLHRTGTETVWVPSRGKTFTDMSSEYYKLLCWTLNSLGCDFVILFGGCSLFSTSHVNIESSEYPREKYWKKVIKKSKSIYAIHQSKKYGISGKVLIYRKNFASIRQPLKIMSMKETHYS